MASPQCEDGYTKIANELLEALCRTRLSGCELRVMLAVLRLTYGYNAKERRVLRRQIAEITGMRENNITRAVRSLTSKHLITLKKDGAKWVIGPNKDYDQWILRKGIKTDTVSKLIPYQNGYLKGIKTDTFRVSNLIPQTQEKPTPDKQSERAKEIYKEIYKYTHSVCDKVLDVFCNTFNVSESYIQGLIKQHGEKVLDYCDYILYLSNKERIRDARRFLAYAIKNGLSPPDGYIPYEQREKKKRERDEALKRLFERQDKEREEIKRRVDAARAYIERIKGTDRYRELYERAKGHKMARFLSIERVMEQLVIEGGIADGD